jgi:DNA-binding transcriptional MerR regulator
MTGETRTKRIVARPPAAVRPQPTSPTSPASPATDVQPGDPEERPLRIGEVARQTGLTTRTIRYYEEMGLLQPSSHRDSGERLYGSADIERLSYIKQFQEFMGFSLAEIRSVLDADDVLEEVRTAYRSGKVADERRILLRAALEANDRLLARLDERAARVAEFRDKRLAKGERIRARLAELDEP